RSSDVVAVRRPNVGIGAARASWLDGSPSSRRDETPMLYAILAYHDEAHVESWSPAEDAALMADLEEGHARLTREAVLGAAARLGQTARARTLRGPDRGMLIDGPFAETKEQLLGFYLVDCESKAAAAAVARDLRQANPGAVYEIRPIRLYRPGAVFPLTEG